jgi:glycosyltransferase involved in cell wall biosynthesis
MKKNKLSVVIIAKNEEGKIEECLKSASWAPEIVVIDNGSTDRTVALAKKHKAVVYEKPDGSYKDLRNEGLKRAKGEWIFYLDADERITSELAEEVKAIINETSNTLLIIPRRNVILGKEMRHGGWWPDYVKRLFLKKNLTGWTGDLHEEPEFTGKIDFLSQPMIHLKHDNLHDMAVKTNKWSNTEAKLLLDAKHPSMAPWRFFRVVFTELFYRLFIKKGILDGLEGIVYATYQSFSKFVTYAKLWEKQL